MNYKEAQRAHVQNLIKSSNIFYGDRGNGTFRKTTYPFVLQKADNNLYAPILDCVKQYFEKNNITWWNGGVTNHPLSSQIACINHLFPIRNDKDVVLKIMKHFKPDLKEVLQIDSDTYNPAYIQFEAVSDKDYLKENSSKRGSYCTSIDALVYGILEDSKKIIFPIEWKFTEVYYNTDKSEGSSGDTRKKRYTCLINHSAQLKDANHSFLYFEPFYQLMRQTLWAEQMIAHKNDETIKADEYFHIHVIPEENKQLLNRTYKCSGKNMKNTWHLCIGDQDKYITVTPKEFLSELPYEKYNGLLEYLENRYW